MADSELLLKVNKAIMGVNPMKPPINENPKIHIGMNPLFMTMRSELYYLKKLNLNERRKKLQELWIQDFIAEEKELRQVGLAFINNVK